MSNFSDNERIFVGARHFEMLEALRVVPGCDDFITSLRPKLKTDRGWRAEVMALYEINKPTHPLKQISSSNHGGAEGIFTYQGRDALLEVASVSYFRVFSKDERSVCEQSFNNTVGAIRRHLTTETQGVWCFIESADSRGSKEDRIAIYERLADCPGDEWTLERSWGTIYYTPDQTKVGWYPARERFGVDRLGILYTRDGFQTMDESPDYTARVLGVLKRKQKQHSDKTVALKLYYFLLEVGIDFDDVLDVSQVTPKLKPDEGLVLAALQSAGSLMVTRKVIYPVELELDLSNSIYPHAANSNEARALQNELNQ